MDKLKRNIRRTPGSVQSSSWSSPSGMTKISPGFKIYSCCLTCTVIWFSNGTMISVEACQCCSYFFSSLLTQKRKLEFFGKLTGSYSPVTVLLIYSLSCMVRKFDTISRVKYGISDGFNVPLLSYVEYCDGCLDTIGYNG